MLATSMPQSKATTRPDQVPAACQVTWAPAYDTCFCASADEPKACLQVSRDSTCQSSRKLACRMPSLRMRRASIRPSCGPRANRYRSRADPYARPRQQLLELEHVAFSLAISAHCYQRQFPRLAFNGLRSALLLHSIIVSKYRSFCRSRLSIGTRPLCSSSHSNLLCPSSPTSRSHIWHGLADLSEDDCHLQDLQQN